MASLDKVKEERMQKRRSKFREEFWVGSEKKRYVSLLFRRWAKLTSTVVDWDTANSEQIYASAVSSAGTGVALFGGPLGGPPIFGGGGTPLFPFDDAKSSFALFSSPSLK
jgi:hypothetical protein